MRLLIWVLAIFAAAVGLTLAAKYTTGYALLVIPPYRVELSLNLLVFLLLAGFAAGYGVIRLAANALRLPSEVRAYRERRAREKARAEMLAALRAFFEGRYAKAEKAAAKALEMYEAPGIMAVVAARCAHELRNVEKRDAYLVAAETSAPEDVTLRLMTEAEFLLDERRPQDALQVLRRLREVAPRQHTAAVKLELKAQQQARNWDEVLKLVDQLDRRSAFDAALAHQMKRHAHLENLKAKSLHSQALNDYWEKIPAADKKDSKIAVTAAHAFMSLGGCVIAHHIVEQALEAQWDAELVTLYGECLGQDALKQIERAENWLNFHPDDATLLLTLGRLCAHQGLWGKAQSYLEASLSVAPSREAHVALARLAEKMERPEDACRHYQKSLDLAMKG